MVEVKRLSKSIKGNLVLDDVNLQMEKGKIYGIVGKNGSGKTMLLRCMAGLVKPTSGEIWYEGKKLYRDIEVPPETSIIIENMGLYPEFSGFQNLKFLAGIRKKITEEEIREAIERVGLNPEDKRPLKKYSLGMRQRIIIAQAIMEKPGILLLDEPTNGLDDKGIVQIREIIRQEAERGAMVVFTSHNREDIEQLCEKTFYMESGRLEEMP